MAPQVIYGVAHSPFWDGRVAMNLYLGGAVVGAVVHASCWRTAGESDAQPVHGYALAPISSTTLDHASMRQP